MPEDVEPAVRSQGLLTAAKFLQPGVLRSPRSFHFSISRRRAHSPAAARTNEAGIGNGRNGFDLSVEKATQAPRLRRPQSILLRADRVIEEEPAAITRVRLSRILLLDAA